MKKLASLFLALIMVLGLATAGFAATGRITDVILPIDTNYSFDIDNAKPGTTWTFPLTANMFDWSDGVAGAAGAPVTKAQLSNSNVTLKTTGLESSMIKSAAIDTTTYNGKTTACIKVEFVDEFVSTGSLNFKTSLYLAVKNSRKEASKIVLEGTFENEQLKVNSGWDYADISKGKVLVPSEYIKDLEIDLGSGVLIRTRVYSNQKYYGIAKEEVTQADSAVLNKYNSIDTIVILKTVGLKSSGNIVLLDGYEGYYVYDSSGKYLGKAASETLMAFSEKYYLSKTKIDMGGGTAGSGNSSSSNAGNSGNSGGFGNSGNSGNSGSTITGGGAITSSAAKTQTQSAVQTAKSGGSTSASVRFKDMTSISAAVLKDIHTTASASGMSAKLVADTMNGTSVSGRVTINANAGITSDIQLGVYVDSVAGNSTKTTFEKWYKNKMVVISLAQKGSYGTQVKIAVKVSLSSLNTNSLVFYSYDKAANKYTKITNPSYSVDTNGYLHFYTTGAGDIIITDSALAKK